MDRCRSRPPVVHEPDKKHIPLERGAGETVGADGHGFHDGNPLVLRAILQHEPRSVAGYITKLGATRVTAP